MALGHVSPDLYGVLLEELAPYCDEFMASGRAAGGGGSKSSKAKGRADELRRTVSHVFRWAGGGCRYQPKLNQTQCNRARRGGGVHGSGG